MDTIQKDWEGTLFSEVWVLPSALLCSPKLFPLLDIKEKLFNESIKESLFNESIKEKLFNESKPNSDVKAEFCLCLYTDFGITSPVHKGLGV